MSEPIPSISVPDDRPTAVPEEAAPPPETTWLLQYSGTESLTKGDYTWQPGQTQPVPESLARTLFGSNGLRVVTDPDLAAALAERAG